MNRKLIAMAAAGVMLVSTVPAFTAFAQDSTPATEVVTDVETAGPEDVVVHTSIGSGQVIFHKTEEAADITAQDLKARVKDAVVKAAELETFDAFLDLEADVKIKLGEGEENQLGIVASAIGTAQEYAHKEHGTFFYSLDGLGVPMSGNYGRRMTFITRRFPMAQSGASRSRTLWKSSLSGSRCSLTANR